MNRTRLRFLFIVLLALPYSFDVVYCEDLTPSHFAQAVSGEGKDVDPSDLKDCLLVPDDQSEHIGSGCAVWGTGLLRPACQTSVSLPGHYLVIASLISRPPPIL